MKILVDSHSHTIVSGHAYSTRIEMIKAAKEKGLEALALTEHAPKMPGTCHEFYFQNYMVVPRKVEGVQVMMGVELNILDEFGTIDLPERVLKSMDLAIASIHGPCYGESRSVELNTQAYLNAMKNPYIHIIGHPDDGRFPVDYEKIVRAAKETHTLLELNNSSQRPDGFRTNAKENAKEFLEICRKEEVCITTGSDAHIDLDVGEFGYIESLIQEIDFPEELIATTSFEKFYKAEQMINEIDKALAEQGDKIDDNQKAQATALRDELKKALDANDMATLEAKMSELEQVAQQMAAYQYQQSQQGANPTGDASNTATQDDDVVDADFTEKN